MPKVVKLQTVAEIVDKMGALKAAMAPLEKEFKKLGAQLKAKGKGRYEGALWDATVSVYDRDNLNMDAVRAKLSHQFITANTTTTEVRKVEMSAKLPAVLAA
jgi:hypothetical protein